MKKLLVIFVLFIGLWPIDLWAGAEGEPDLKKVFEELCSTNAKLADQIADINGADNSVVLVRDNKVVGVLPGSSFFLMLADLAERQNSEAMHYPELIHELTQDNILLRLILKSVTAKAISKVK